MRNPFGTTFETLENVTGPLVEGVHEGALRRLRDLLERDEGRLISLRAPRAGYGKTVVLRRFKKSQEGKALVVPIHLSGGQVVSGESVLEELLTEMTEPVKASGGVTRLDLHTRRLFAHALLPMVYSGEVPSQDREGAMMSLRERPTEALNFHHEGAAIAQWTKGQFEVLVPRLAGVLGQSTGASTRDALYWANLFFRYATSDSRSMSRAGDLLEEVFGKASRFRAGAGYLDGVVSFLKMVSLVEPVVLILDEVDGLANHGDLAMKAASCLIAICEASPRTSVIFSVNEDVWESAFGPRLPGGMRDRLEDVVVRLEDLSDEEVEALVRGRAGEDAGKVLARMDLAGVLRYPRAVLRAARDAWEVIKGEGGVGKGEEEMSAGWAVTEEKKTCPYPPYAAMRVALPRRFEVVRVGAVRPSVFPDFGGAAPTASPFEMLAPGAGASQPKQGAQGSGGSPFEQVESVPWVQKSPFEPSARPVSAPEIQDLGGKPYEGTFTGAEEKRDLRFYPSNSPFQVNQGGEEGQRPVSSPGPPPISAASLGYHTPGGNSPQASPFEPIHRPQAPPTSETNAVDELLRQFREHRDS